MAGRKLCIFWVSLISLSLVVAGFLKLEDSEAFSPLPISSSTDLGGKAAAIAQDSAHSSPTIQKRLLENYGKLPLHFEANQGQTDSRVRFLSRGYGYTIFLTDTGAVLSLREHSGSKSADFPGSPPVSSKTHSSSASQDSENVLRMKLEGANRPARISGLDNLSGTANYFIGNDPRKWHRAIPTYAKVRYKNVYPGIDLVYYGNQQQLEYDFSIAPGADPRAIRFSLEGGTAIRLDDRGNLVVGERGEEIRFTRPEIYQEISGHRVSVPGSFVLLSARKVGFQVGSYDRTKELMIDPVLSYSTYLGDTSFDQGFGIAVDSSGNVYLTGYTSSWYFPTTSGALKSTRSGLSDALISKLNANGTALVYSTFFGGSASDQGTAIAVDSSGSAYVTGQTYSSNFPTTAGALKGSYGGSGDAFVAKLSPNGTSLSYSTYLGGSGTDESRGIAVDSSNNAYVTGMTYSSNFPTMSALQISKNGIQDAFVTELNATGSLVYSTYLGGNSYDLGNGIAVDSSGDAYVTGYTKSADFPTTGALQATCGSCPDINDAFVAEISANGTGLVYSTFLGGGGYDAGTGIAVDAQGNAYVTGFTFSADFPTTAGAFQRSLLGTVSAFVTQISPNGSPFVYSTYLGADRYTYGSAIALFNGNAYVAGVTSSTSLPLVDPLQSSNHGVVDGFISQLNAAGSSLGFSTYLGGTRFDEANAIAVDPSGNMYATGTTLSTDFPTANAMQSTYGGGNLDAFITKIAVPVSVTFSPSSLTFSGQQVGTTSSAKSITMSNPGGTSVSISSISIGGTNSGDFAQTNNCGSSLAGGSTCTIDITFTPSASGTRSGTLSISDSAPGSPHTASLTGSGLTVSISLSPTSLTFSGQQVGTTSSSQPVTLSNPGGTSVSISSISIGGTNSGDFAQTNNCGSSLAAGSNCTVNVTFTPGASGTRSGTLTISDSASGSPHTASLTGTGLTASVSLTPSSLTFSSQNVGTTSAFQAVTLSNSGGATVTISSISIGGTNSGDFAQTNNCGSSVAAGSSCTINVTFTPSASGTRSGTLSISDSASGSPHTASLTGTGVIPAITLSPSSLTFTGQAVGTTSSAQSVTLSNPGGTSVSISGISITGTNNGDFAQTNNCGSSVAAKGSCSINVTFSPSAAGTRSGTLSISDSASGSPHTASLTGTGLTASVSLSPSSLTFSSQNVGTTSASQAVTLSNSGGAAVSISSISIGGTNSGDFAQTNNCGSSVSAGSSCTINVTFTPSASGTRSGTLSISDSASGSPHTASLTGTGVIPAITLSPSSLTFTGQAVGTTSSAQSVTLSNPGNTTVSISSVSITGTNSADFAQTNNCGSSVAAGSSCTVNVTFTPGAGGTRSGTLSVSDSSSGSPHTAGLSGTGLTASVSLSPSSLTFSSQNVGTTSASQAVTLSNSGGAAVSISSISIGGTNSGDFSQINNCGSSVAAGSSCTINVTFTPSASGTRSGTLSINDSASGSPHTASLTGTGVIPSITLSPSSLTFAGQAVGTTSSAQSVTLSNPGGTSVSISGISITGTNNGDFAQTNNCGSGVAAGSSCTINVAFTPSAAGTRSGTLVVSDSSSGSPHTAGLTGTGLAASADLSPSSLNFGKVNIGTTSAQAVTLRNTGSATLTIGGFEITGSNSSDYAQSNNCSASLAPGAACSISVVFRPTSKGNRSAALLVTDNASDSPQQVSLRGNGH